MDHDPGTIELTIDRYLLKEMIPAEELEWEEHYFDCDQCFNELKNMSAVRSFLTERTGRAAEALEEIPRREGWATIHALTRRPTLAAAAVVLIISIPAIVGWIKAGNLQAELEVTRLPALSTGSYLLQEGVREGEVPTLRPPEEGPFLIHFNLLTSMTESSSYRASILDGSREVVWRLDDLRTDDTFGTFTILSRGSFFKPGAYELVVEEVRPDDGAVLNVFTFPFRVAAHDTQ
jgi:hypothetical protein